jgi:FkbM family methyltransferase
MKLFNKVVDISDGITRVYMRANRYIRPVGECKTYFGATIVCDIGDFIQRRIYFFKIYEPNLTYFITAKLRPGDTFVDLGANIGYFSLLASKIVGPAGSVIAVEASPQTFGLLKANLDRNHCENVTALNVAATEKPTFVEIMTLDATNSGMTQIKLKNERAAGLIEGKPLLDILGDAASKVNFIKIDIERSEAPVLEDILENLDRFAPRLTVVAELQGPGSDRFVKRFRDAGFQAYGMPQNYKIGYFLLRDSLARFGEHSFYVTVPVDQYSTDYNDFVFVRGAGD